MKLVFGVFVLSTLACSDLVEPGEQEPWELAEPNNESLCPELIGWEPDDAFRRLPAVDGAEGLVMYERRLPLGFDGCGVYATKAVLRDHAEGTPWVMWEAQICNRCEREMQMMWIGDPTLYERNWQRDWRGREVEGQDLKMDLGSAAESDILAARSSSYNMGPVAFMSDAETGAALGDSCISQDYRQPPAIFRATFDGKDVLSMQTVLHVERDAWAVCGGQRADNPDLLNSNAQSARTELVWPRLRELDVAYAWEEASYLPGAACEEQGVSAGMCSTCLDFDSSCGAFEVTESQRPALSHQRNHVVQDLGVIEFPVEVREVLLGDQP